MSKFDERINELFEVLTEAALLNTVLNTIITFLISYIFFSLINFFPIPISIIISMFYLLIIWIIKSSFYDIKLVEKKFPFLKERLSTAKETINKENFVINALRLDVSRRINHIDASTFFRTGRTVFKIFVILFLLFGLMFFTVNDIELIDLNQRLSGFNLAYFFSFFNSNQTKEINETFNFTDKLDPTKLEEIYDRFKKEEFISYEELDAIASEEFRESITDEEREIVRRYFETIRER
ncbi:MAG: hypothetical protein ACMXX8_00030 [Candidatus Woesearchaeota archaeon]